MTRNGSTTSKKCHSSTSQKMKNWNKSSKDLDFSFKDQVDTLNISRPHLVILGAGATKATLPNGDKNKKPVPLMCDLMTRLKLNTLLEKHGISNEKNNFEAFYSSIYETKPKLSSEIEDKIYSYFSSLKIPDELTLYDFLILFLREKDCIATFNWDPILNQALARNFPILYNNYGLQPPKIIYLHGNVAVGHCPNKCTTGPIGHICSKCNTKYVKSKLLYPISKKNYSINSFVENQWKRVMNELKHAYLLTIFGYSAPTSDQEAMNLFKKGWGNWQEKRFEEIEFINTENEDIYVERWKDFIHTHHYGSSLKNGQLEGFTFHNPPGFYCQERNVSALCYKNPQYN